VQKTPPLTGRPREEPESVLVLGAGFIGSHIVRALLDRGHRVIVLSRSSPRGLARELTSGADFIIGDAGVTQTLSQAIAGAQHVVCALGSLMPGEAEQEPQLDLSLTLQPLLELLRQLGEGPGLPVTFLSSGGTVYGRSDLFPTPESAPTAPVSAYGITKLTAEKFVLRYAALHSTFARVLRIGNAYGTGQITARGQGVVGAALEHCQNGEPLVVFGDGSVSRDFVHVEDLGSVASRLVEIRSGPSIVNIGSGVATSISAIHDIAQEESGRPLDVVYKDGRAFDVPRVELDISLLRSLVDYDPRPIRAGIRQTWDELEAGRRGAARAEQGTEKA
jgi:UDP-glucose 4-epimerase